MNVKPVIFSAPMVQALLDGRKTQTRRVLKPQPHFYNVWQDEDSGDWWQSGHGEAGDDLIHLPHNPGDLLWVREAWRVWRGADDAPPRALSEDAIVIYEAGGASEASEGYRRASEWPKSENEFPKNLGKVRQVIHMPRWASRLTLEVTAVKVERLQAISETDAVAEGMTFGAVLAGDVPMSHGPVNSFAGVWDSLNAKRGFGWDANPWVCAITFTVRKRNVDDLLSQREKAA